MMKTRLRFGDLYAQPSRNGLMRPSRVRGEGYKMVNMGELFANARIGDIPMERVPMNEREIERFSLEEGDLLFARQSLVLEGAGKCSYVASVPETTTFESHLIRVRLDRRRAFPLFYHYLFASPYSGMSTIVQQCAQAGIRASDLAELSVIHPSVETQKQIAFILSTYDELIENNRRRMALLEDAVRQVYQEWFVRLRFPGYEHTRIVDGVPEGWVRVQLQSIINVTHGYAFQGSNFSEHPTSRVLATPGNFRIGGGIKFDKLKYYGEDAPLQSSYVLQSMDLILTMTDLSKMCDTLGFPAFVPKLNGLTFLHNQRIGKVVPTGHFFPKHFLYCMFCGDEYRQHVVGAATGTSVKHTSPKRILNYTTPIPIRGALINTFEEFAEPIFQQINVLLEMNQKLRAARDLLLPKLMSGEIAV